MNALIQLRVAVTSAQTAQAKAKSELAQAVVELRKWEDRERLLIDVDNPQLANATAFRKSVCKERVKSLTSLVNANVETVSRLERQLAKWDAVEQPVIPSVRVVPTVPTPSPTQRLQDRQNALNEKISKLTVLLFDVQQEFQTLKKDIEKNALTGENQEAFSDLELEKLRILLDELGVE